MIFDLYLYHIYFILDFLMATVFFLKDPASTKQKMLSLW